MSTRDPNVLLVAADDQRFDTIHALGNDHIETPNFDRLVGEGCAFTRHHNVGSQHGAVCVPARAMLMSGRSLFTLDDPGRVTRDHAPLPQRFSDAGYRTFATGKWHNGTDDFNRCFDEGKRVFFGGMGNHWNVPVSSRHPTGEYSWHPHRTDLGTGTVQSHDRVYDRYESGTHSSELFADTTIDFLRDHHESADDRPFFAYMATMAPHDPRTAPGEYLSKYDPGDIPLPENFTPEHPFDIGWQGRDENLEEHPRDPEKVRRHIADYYAMITHLDAQIGRILDELEAIGERENTIVVFTADHGLSVGQHGLMGKQNLYDHSVRVPFLIAGPGVPEAARRDVLSCHYDLYPTLCDLAGVDAPSGLDGESLVPTMTDEAVSPREDLFLAFRDIHRAVREPRYKLIEYTVDGDHRTQLFDTDADPAETTDLSDDPAYADVRDRLRDRLAQYKERTGSLVQEG